MSGFSVPYGSHQLPVERGCEFVLPWVNQLSMPDEELTREHLAILEKLNNLLHALNSGDPTLITMAGGVMSAEARSHFAKEEEMMEMVDYPDRAAHIEQHEELLRRLNRMRNVLAFDIAPWSPAVELSMLERWFVPHLSYADRAFADFIGARRDAPETS
jgi:hemerythrin